MNFELALKDVAEEYGRLLETRPADYQARTEQLLRRELQAKEVKFDEEAREPYCKAIVVAPGLLTHCGMENAMEGELVRYEGRNGDHALVEGKNGFAELYLIEGFSERLEKVSLDFSPKIPLPEGSWDPSRAFFKCQLPTGTVNAFFGEEHSACYKPQKNLPDDLAFKFQLHVINRPGLGSGYFVKWMKFPVETLGHNVVSDLLQDLGYVGLERLVERKVPQRSAQ